MRAGTRRWPPKYEILNEAKTEKKVNILSGRIAQHFRCASCGEDFPAKGVQVDHILPVVPNSGFTSWDSYIENIFCEKENFQVLCVECHQVKTKEERIATRSERKE